MGIVKIVSRRPKSKAGLKRTIRYVLRNDKEELLSAVTGPYANDKVSSDSVYNAFLDEKMIWHKMDGRQCTHSIVSWHRDELITPEEALKYGVEFAESYFFGYQALVVVHEEKSHLHTHIVTNSVSYLDGRKLHETRDDLMEMRRLNDELCKKYGLVITEKGKTYEGINREGMATWNMNKHKVIEGKSDIQDCFEAVERATFLSKTKDEFVDYLMRVGWHVNWNKNRKHIVFYNDKGRKFRDSNLSRTFCREISMERLERTFQENRDAKESPVKSTQEIEIDFQSINNISSREKKKHIQRKNLYFERDFIDQESIDKER